MSKINDGGCAFPFEGGTNNGYSPDPGMTLRDWFATHAMQAVLSSAEASSEDAIPKMMNVAARISYIAADAMLAAREGEKP